MQKIMIIQLGENLQGKHFRVPKKTKLIFKPSPQTATKDIRILTNYPLTSAAAAAAGTGSVGFKFDRNSFSELQISFDHQDLISSSFNWTTSVTFAAAGTFLFGAVDANEQCNNSDSSLSSAESLAEKALWSAYVVVEPELLGGKLEVDSVRCQTVLTKNLGSFDKWPKYFEFTKECNYNAIHLTPIQQLGSSQSAYSIYDHLKVDASINANLDTIKKQIDCMQKKWQMITITDIVLNHVASNCAWIRENPEGSYNLENSKHLRPAFLLDLAIRWLQADLCAGSLLATHNINARVTSESDIQALIALLRAYYVPLLKIHELFMIDVDAACASFDKLKHQLNEHHQLCVNYDKYERRGAVLKAIPAYIKTVAELKHAVLEENNRKRAEIESHIHAALSNVAAAIRYERLDPCGPYFKQQISSQAPIVAPYFTIAADNAAAAASLSSVVFNVKQEEEQMFAAGHKFMANNGWVMGADSQFDFAGPNSLIYLRRELVCWGDCIKLRYGARYEDAPSLWQRMKKYVEIQAKTFHGFRIDNCHSTPIHVAEYLIDAARAIRPDIYIMAELFTNTEYTDNLYVNRIGITSLIREAMSAPNSRELGRLMYRYGGTPVGAFNQHGSEYLKPCVAHAMFYDQTHDNESAIRRRSAYDLQATSAILSMAMCATGSTRGYDELVPHQISVVCEPRLYNLNASLTKGLVPLRKLLNSYLQRQLIGYNEIFVDQVNEDIIAITRHNPESGRSIVLVARTCFDKHRGDDATPIREICIQGKVARILFEAVAVGNPNKYRKAESYINGLEEFETMLLTKDSQGVEQRKLFNVNQISANNVELKLSPSTFVASSVIAVEITLSDSQASALKELNAWDFDLTKFNLSLLDANYILFRCAEEDKSGAYELPNFARFTYCGLYGLMYHLERVRENQDQAHPLAKNLRQGNWLSNYIVSRLRQRESCEKIAASLEQALKLVDILPRGMVPKYFDIIITRVYTKILDQLVYGKMSAFVAKGPTFVKKLALSSVALVGTCESAPLPPLIGADKASSTVPSIAAGLPHFASGFMRNWGRDTFISLRGLLLVTGRYAEARAVILSYARTLNYGLIPNLCSQSANRYNCRDAVWWWLYSIKEYVSVAPNGFELLRTPVQRMHKSMSCIKRSSSSSSSSTAQQQSTAKLSNGIFTLHSNGVNHYSEHHIQSNGTSGGGGECQLLYEIMQEALELHFQGLEFVEENAGKKIDEHMTQKGFTVTIGVDRKTGFVYGGNEHNCGTWMDKMGSSDSAGNRGKPATPRDGSAIELVALCKSVVSWLENLNRINARAFPFDGVECLYEKTITLKWTWKKWAQMIQDNFEHCFFIAEQPQLMNGNSVPVELINKRNIYKDTFGASQVWRDLQFRPNFLVAMTVAPELFERHNARAAVLQAKQHLCGPLGMRTLDPADWNYDGNYDNSNNSTDPKIANGFNYHNGPEWLWLTGYYIRASSVFVGGADERKHHLRLLAAMYDKLNDTPWLGLPELTNANGAFCSHSCPIQAWSLATTLEALYESIHGGGGGGK